MGVMINKTTHEVRWCITTKWIRAW